MDDIQELYSMIMGRDASQFENDPEIRHISFYLCELLFKAYNEISTEAKQVHKEDQTARAALHRLVDGSTHSAIRNIRDISNTREEIGSISKPALEVQKLAHKCDSYAMDIIAQTPNILKGLDACDDMKSDNEFLNLVTDLGDEVSHAGEERVSLLMAYEDLLEDISKIQQSKVINILKDNVKVLKRKMEHELYKSFSNNINVTLKVVTDIKMLGMSTPEEISRGFINSRRQCILKSFGMIQSLAQENIYRSISEATLTLKTKIYSILLSYKTIFGDIDVNVTNFIRDAIFQFLQFLRKAMQNTDPSIFTLKHRAELQHELDEISQSFGTFGFSFKPLLQEIFVQ
ncbi:hypothetical protein X943_002443 [Babesia divergens]|uniref:Uncharacterized protein n=1 Tax=Babesia divergens TaxID=32595 RepID=A0AAD9LF46_BABDI|nr:hypothetical protein X943_002443 [Babesia divergens]